jgi:hypothetical protein
MPLACVGIFGYLERPSIGERIKYEMELPHAGDEYYGLVLIGRLCGRETWLCGFPFFSSIFTTKFFPEFFFFDHYSSSADYSRVGGFVTVGVSYLLLFVLLFSSQLRLVRR